MSQADALPSASQSMLALISHSKIVSGGSDVVDDHQRSHSRHNELTNEARHCWLGRSGNDGDEGGGGDHPQRMVKDGL